MKSRPCFIVHNLKNIIVISNCAKFHPKIRWNKGSDLRVKFVFYTTAIRITELGRMSRREVINNNKRVIVVVNERVNVIVVVNERVIVVIESMTSKLSSTHSSRTQPL